VTMTVFMETEIQGIAVIGDKCSHGSCSTK
jgi:hypothetical protein